MKKWIGLFHVKPTKENELLTKGALGAYVNVLALAKNENKFIKKVFNTFKTLMFEIEGFEDVDLFESRLLESTLDKEIIDLADQLSPENSIVFDSFHTYSNKD